MNQKQIAMLHTGRCGSTVLGNMLNSHHMIFWAGEIFEPLMSPNNKYAVDRMVEETINKSRHSVDSAIYGFETKYLPQQQLSNWCINMHLDQYIELLGKLNFTDFIVLHRSNYLRRVISVCVGFKNDSWHSEKEITDPTKITIDVNAYKTVVGRLPLLELFACLDHAYDQLKQILPERSTLYLSYEDDIIDDPGIAYRKTCSFLNIADESPNVNLSRTNPFHYVEMLNNYDEVKNTLSGTKYEWMLDV